MARNNKVEIETELHIELSPNKKRVILQKKNRRITAPISILRIALENKVALDNGQTYNLDNVWNLNVDDWSGVDYICFHKFNEKGDREK